MIKPLRNAYAIAAKLRKGAGPHTDKKNDRPSACRICGAIVDDGEIYCDACRPDDEDEESEESDDEEGREGGRD